MNRIYYFEDIYPFCGKICVVKLKTYTRSEATTDELYFGIPDYTNREIKFFVKNNSSATKLKIQEFLKDGTYFEIRNVTIDEMWEIREKIITGELKNDDFFETYDICAYHTYYSRRKTLSFSRASNHPYINYLKLQYSKIPKIN